MKSILFDWVSKVTQEYFGLVRFCDRIRQLAPPKQMQNWDQSWDLSKRVFLRHEVMVSKSMVLPGDVVAKNKCMVSEIQRTYLVEKVNRVEFLNCLFCALCAGDSINNSHSRLFIASSAHFCTVFDKSDQSIVPRKFFSSSGIARGWNLSLKHPTGLNVIPK